MGDGNPRICSQQIDDEDHITDANMTAFSSRPPWICGQETNRADETAATGVVATHEETGQRDQTWQTRKQLRRVAFRAVLRQLRTGYIIAPVPKLDTRCNRQHTSSAEVPGPMRNASGVPKSKRMELVPMNSLAWTSKTGGSQKNEKSHSPNAVSPRSIKGCLRISRM